MNVPRNWLTRECRKDPKLLYAINGVSAYHIVNGVEECLTPAGPQTLSLLMVPTSSAFADLSVDPQAGQPDRRHKLRAGPHRSGRPRRRVCAVESEVRLRRLQQS